MPKFDDIQIGRVLLSQSAVPRANSTLRTTPPSLTAAFAARHDDGVWNALCDFLGVPVPDGPYPRENSTEQFQARSAARAEA